MKNNDDVENNAENAEYNLERWIQEFPDRPDEICTVYQEGFQGQRPAWFQKVNYDDAVARFARVDWPVIIRRRCESPKVFILEGSDIYNDGNQPYHDRFLDHYQLDKKCIFRLFGKAPLFFRLTLTNDLRLKAFVVTDRDMYKGETREVIPFDMSAFKMMVQPVPYTPETLASYVRYRCRTGKQPPPLRGTKNLGKYSS